MADAAPTKISTSLKRKMSDPTSAENLLECYTKHQKKYMEETNKKWMALSDKMQKTMMELVEKNHENSLLKKQLLAVKEQLEGLKTTCSDLSKQNDTLKKETLACNKKYAQLEIVYDSEFASMSETLTKQKAELLEAANMYAQLKADQDKKHQLVVQLETMLLEKDVQLAEMKSQNSQLQADIEQWKATFEQYKVDVTKSNEKIQAELESKVQEQAAKIRQLTEGNELRDAELQIAMANMQKVEDRNVELTKQNLQLSTEMADISKCLDAVKEQNNQMLEGINSQNVKLLDDINSYQKHLAKLVEENKQLKTASGEAAAMAEIKLIAVTNESNELKKKLEEIEKKHLAETTSLLAEKAELNEKLKDITQLHEANVATLELNIKEKETCQTQYEEKLAELERTKNITIAELTYKVNQIKNLSVLPLRLPKITSTNQQDKHSTTTAKPITLNSITPSETSSTNENPQNTLLGAKRRKATKQPPGSLYNTDFNTDSENEEESSDHKHSSSKLPKMNRSAPAKKGLNTFDKLKFSKDP